MRGVQVVWQTFEVDTHHPHYRLHSKGLAFNASFPHLPRTLPTPSSGISGGRGQGQGDRLQAVQPSRTFPTHFHRFSTPPQVPPKDEGWDKVAGYRLFNRPAPSPHIFHTFPTPPQVPPEDEGWDKVTGYKLFKAARLCQLYGRLEQAEPYFR